MKQNVSNCYEANVNRDWCRIFFKSKDDCMDQLLTKSFKIKYLKT